MPVAVACSCGAEFHAPDSAVGERVNCPKCGEALTVPAEVVDLDAADHRPQTAAKKATRKRPRLLGVGVVLVLIATAGGIVLAGLIGKPARWTTFEGDGFTLEVLEGLPMADDPTLGYKGPNIPQLQAWSTAFPERGRGLRFTVLKGKVNPTLLAEFEADREATWREVVRIHSKPTDGETVSAARQVQSAAGLEGWEFTRQRAEGRQTVRFYMVGRHLYTLTVVQLGDTTDDPRVEKYLASFRPE
jgi:hypothetical protein